MTNTLTMFAGLLHPLPLLPHQMEMVDKYLVLERGRGRGKIDMGYEDIIPSEARLHSGSS